MRQILAATDGSEGAGRAVDFAAQMASRMGAELRLLTVGETLPPEEMHRLTQAERDVGSVLESLCEHILREAAARAERGGAPVVHREAAWGDPAEAILRIADSRRVDAIVLGRRGRGRLAGLLLGSVSQKVVSLASCATLVVP